MSQPANELQTGRSCPGGEASLRAADSRAISRDGERAIWTRRAIGVLAAVLVLRWAYAAWVPLDLVHDEAYYWDWSRQLDWGYYSKPPMIAWLIGLSTWLGGASELSIRTPAVLLSVGTLGFVFLLGQRLYGSRAGFWAMLLAAATPGNAVLGLIMTIDAPFVFCWCVSLYAFWQFIDEEKPRVRWIVLATLATGLGILTKQTMLGFLPLAALFLSTSAQHRRQLRRPAFWTWGVASLLFLLPVIWWNSQNGWITVQHTSEHFTTESSGWANRLLGCGEFLVTQMGVVSPIIWCVGVAALVAAGASYFRLEPRDRFLLCFSAVPLAGVVGLSLTQKVEPNWPAAFYPAGFVLLAAYGLQAVGHVKRPRFGLGTLRLALACGVILVIGTYLIPFGFGLQGSRLDPAVRLRGWRELGEQVETRFAALPDRQRTFVIVSHGRSLVSELAFYMPTQPRVYLWNRDGSIMSQYDVWGGPDDKLGWDALIVMPGEQSRVPSRLAAEFDRLEPAGSLDVEIGHGRSHSIQLWRGLGYRSTTAARIGEGPRRTMR